MSCWRSAPASTRRRRTGASTTTLKVIRIDLDPVEIARMRGRRSASLADASEALAALCRRSAPATARPGADARRGDQGRGAGRSTGASSAPQLRLHRGDPRRPAGRRHLGRGPDPDRLCRPHRLSGVRAAHYITQRLSGHARVQLSDGARRQGRAARPAGRVDLGRRRLHVQRPGAGHRRAARHRRRGASCSTTAPTATSAACRASLRQPADRDRPAQPGFRPHRRELRHRRARASTSPDELADALAAALPATSRP